MSGNYEVVVSPDEYSIVVERDKVRKEFQFDRVYMPDCTQDQVRPASLCRRPDPYIIILMLKWAIVLFHF